MLVTVTLLYSSFLINVKQRNHSWPVKLKTFGCNGNDIQLASENVLAKPRFLLSVLPLSGRKKKYFFWMTGLKDVPSFLNKIRKPGLWS